MPDNDIAITTSDGLILAQVQCADFDEKVAQNLLQELSAAAEQSPVLPVLLDLTKVTGMPSMAIGALVTLLKKFQDSHQRFILVGLQPPVRNTLAVCRLDKLFEFTDTVEGAKTRIQRV